MTNEHYCGGELVEADIAWPIGQRGGRDITVWVRGRVCRSCGREQFSAAVAEQIERALDEPDYYKQLRNEATVSTAFMVERSASYAHAETRNQSIQQGLA
jgi:hypothetical protein